MMHSRICISMGSTRQYGNSLVDEYNFDSQILAVTPRPISITNISSEPIIILPMIALGEKVTIKTLIDATVYPNGVGSIDGASSFTMIAGSTKSFLSQGYNLFYTDSSPIPILSMLDFSDANNSQYIGVF